MPVELLVVEGRAGLHQVVHRPLGREPEGEADVAELEVEVDEDDVRVALGERDREVRRDERLAGAALRAEDRDDRGGRLAGHGEALAPGDDLLERERDLLRRLRERDHVVRARLERLPEEAVGRGLAHHDDRPVGPVLDGVVHHGRHAVVVAVAADDDHVAGLLEELPPVVEMLGVADDLERCVALERLLDEPRVGVLGEGDENADRVSHLSLPSRCR